MKVLLQRVRRASVRVDGRVTGSVGQGLLAFVGVERGDEAADAVYLANKTAELRVFPDAQGKMNRSLIDAGLGVLVVSQFTLAATTRHGRRPSFTRAEDAEPAAALCRLFCARLRERGLVVSEGVFQTHMEVELVNDGPVTILLDPPPRRACP
jgi:D-tyrosyl-tRNA(Tyr) deacylase